MHCSICKSRSNFIFKKKFLQKYEASLFQCSSCGFVQTENPYWLEEAYKLPFTPLDVKIVSRPIELGQLTENLILNYFDYSGKFIDYGGGVGLFTRLMRDRGLNFYRQDKYAQNLFTQYFDISDLSNKDRNFELATSFEVLEHLENPLDEISEIFALSKNAFCSTILQPSSSIEELESWYYIAELHGQHISFYTHESMKVIARKFNCSYYGYGDALHLFTPKRIDKFSLSRAQSQDLNLSRRIKNKVPSKIRSILKNLAGEKKIADPLKSLVEDDTEMITNKLTQQQQRICK
jgi:hypothetical protein